MADACTARPHSPSVSAPDRQVFQHWFSANTTGLLARLHLKSGAADLSDNCQLRRNGRRTCGRCLLLWGCACSRHWASLARCRVENRAYAVSWSYLRAMAASCKLFLPSERRPIMVGVASRVVLGSHVLSTCSLSGALLHSPPDDPSVPIAPLGLVVMPKHCVLFFQ